LKLVTLGNYLWMFCWRIGCNFKLWSIQNTTT